MLTKTKGGKSRKHVVLDLGSSAFGMWVRVPPLANTRFKRIQPASYLFIPVIPERSFYHQSWLFNDQPAVKSGNASLQAVQQHP